MKKIAVPMITGMIGFVLGALLWPDSEADWFRLRHPLLARQYIDLQPVSAAYIESANHLSWSVLRGVIEGVSFRQADTNALREYVSSLESVYLATDAGKNTPFLEKAKAEGQLYLFIRDHGRLQAYGLVHISNGTIVDEDKWGMWTK